MSPIECPRCGGTERYQDGRCAPCTRESNQRWKANNRTRHRSGSLKWQTENVEARRAIAREWGRRNRAAVDATRRAWRKAHPEGHAAHEQARRARKRASGGTYTAREWLALCATNGQRCLCCGQSDVKLTVDHVVPLSRGGTNDIANIQPLCGPCNSAKGTATTDYRAVA